MIVVLKPGTGAEKKEKLIQWLEHQGMRVHISDGEFQTVLGIIGDASRLDLTIIIVNRLACNIVQTKHYLIFKSIQLNQINN